MPPMDKTIPSFFMLACCLLAFACVPKSRVTSLEEELSGNREQLERVRTENDQLAVQRDQLVNEIEQLSTQQQQLEETNQRLSADIEQLTMRAQQLKIDLEKQRSVVQLQEKVIHLLDDTEKTIESSLREQMAAEGIEIVEMKDEVKVVLLDKILYEPGSLEIHEKGKMLLKVLAETIRDNPDQQLVVIGHTDSMPISKKLREKYPTNWELSAARAAAVIRYLQYQCNMDPKTISLKAYGPYRPLASNQTEKGRRQNRRIEIILGSSDN